MTIHIPSDKNLNHFFQIPLYSPIFSHSRFIILFFKLPKFLNFNIRMIKFILLSLYSLNHYRTALYRGTAAYFVSHFYPMNLLFKATRIFWYISELLLRPNKAVIVRWRSLNTFIVNWDGRIYCQKDQKNCWMKVISNGVHIVRIWMVCS